jgi:hypothetical protein
MRRSERPRLGNCFCTDIAGVQVEVTAHRMTVLATSELAASDPSNSTCSPRVHQEITYIPSRETPTHLLRGAGGGGGGSKNAPPPSPADGGAAFFFVELPPILMLNDSPGFREKSRATAGR